VADADGNIGGMIMWNGQFEVLNAYGSAFASGEVFNWFLWDASTDTYYEANAVYDDSYSHTNQFQSDGISGITDIVTRTIYMQSIDLSAGWGLYSTYITNDNSLETNLSGITESLVIVKDENGQVFWPLLGINEISNLVNGEGYQIKMGSVDLLEIYGDLIPSDYEMFTPAGWSYIAYLHQDPADAETMMAPVEDLIILKDGSGSVYWPFLGVNMIDGGSGMMKPGQGYSIKVPSDNYFSYPDLTLASRFAANATPVYPLTKFRESINTGSNMTIGIPADSWETLPEEGDEIAAYTENGLLVGSATYTGESTALTIWGDDMTTDEVEGLVEGESISFELWRKSEDRIETLDVRTWVEGDNVYSVNGIAVAGNITTSTKVMGYELYPNVPNPFGAKTTVSFFAPEDGNVKVGIYDMLGNLVEELTNEDYESGMYMLEFSSENVAPGTYFIRMNAAGFYSTRNITIVK
ncbi:MAG: hypothetical protein CMP65_01400, partial [Flavobacteriales bacterium]|nr:hypothetical protein [Flavobacteriales bacterium]